MLQKIHFEGLKPNTQYYFQVVGTSADGALKSAPSNIISFTTISDTTPPNPISSLTTDFSTTTFTATWAGPDINDTPDFLDYKVVLTNPSNTASKTIYTKNKFIALTLDENRNIFGAGTPSASIQISASSRDTSGNLSTGVSTTAINPAPTTTPVISASGIPRGFSTTWPAIPDTFNDYAYTIVYVGGTEKWRGTGTYMQYTSPAYALATNLAITAQHFDVFNQPSSLSNTENITTVSPVVFDGTPPNTPTGLVLVAGNSGGAAGLGGYITASWTEPTDVTLRGVKLRLNAQGDTIYQYENVSSSVQTYQINNLIPGFTYEIAVASFDEINNTSSFSPLSNVTIPYNTSPFTASATATLGASIVTITSTFSASNIGAIVAGTGIKPGTRVLAINSNSASLSTVTTASLSNTKINFYPGISNWQSYITAGVDDGTGALGSSSYMKLGTGVSGTKHGLWLNNNNYWYTTGTFKVGSDTSYFSWDGTTASISGDIRANSGSFLGNVNIASNGSLYAGNSPTSGARTIFNASGVVGYNSSGSNTFLLDSTTGYLTASGATISGTINGLTVGFGGGNISTNLALGALALTSNTTGATNFAAGYALTNNTSGNNNVAIGYQTLNNSASTNNNIAIGSQSLYTLSSGNNNIAIGYQSFFRFSSSVSNSVGIGNKALYWGGSDNNIAIGPNAMYNSKLNNNSIAIGSDALYGADTIDHGNLVPNMTGNFNIALGSSAAYSTSSGSTNIAIGYKALFSNDTGLDNIAIGSSALYNAYSIATQNVAIGYQALRNTTIGQANIAIGSQALVSNDIGNENIAIGNGALLTNTNDYNIAIGSNSLLNNSGKYNIGLGSFSLYTNQDSNNNIAIGYYALYSNTKGSNNIAFGTYTMRDSSSITSYNNIAIGASAAMNMKVDGNIAIGIETLRYNNNGYQNTAIGTRSMGYNYGGTLYAPAGNTYLGWQAGYKINSGAYDVGIGLSSLVELTSGNANTAIGAFSGSYQTSGDYNTYLGYAAGCISTNTTISNAVAIGNSAIASATNDFVLGTTSHNVKIPGTLTLKNTQMKRVVAGTFAATGTASFGTGGTGITTLTYSLGFTPTVVMVIPQLGLNLYQVAIGAAPTSTGVQLKGYNSTGGLTNSVVSTIYWVAYE